MTTSAALRALRSRDARFDGLFFYGVTSTGIFCRPSCPAPPAKVEHIRIFPTADAAIAAGFRSCKRCRPGASPGAPEWDIGSDVARRAVRLISDGATDERGVGELASRLGYSDRQIRRYLLGALGATPVALARSRRANAARILLETTEMANAEVAFAAGFRSLRQFHETLRAIYDRTPGELRSLRPGTAVHDGTLSLSLAYRSPIALLPLFAALAADAATGVANFAEGTYRRAVTLPRGEATVAISRGRPGAIACDLILSDLRDLPVVVARVRRFLDLDADPTAISETLGPDLLLGPAWNAEPGVRNLGSLEPLETLCSLLLAPSSPESLPDGLGRLLPPTSPPNMPEAAALPPFPRAEQLLSITASVDRLAVTDRERLTAVLELVADGTLDLSIGADPEAAVAVLSGIRGIPNSVLTGVRRAIFGDPDVLDVTDPAALDAYDRLDGGPHAAALAETATSWRPWRTYAAAYLMAHPTRTAREREVAS